MKTNRCNFARLRLSERMSQRAHKKRPAQRGRPSKNQVAITYILPREHVVVKNGQPGAEDEQAEAIQVSEGAESRALSL
jgi:hypothetical protein